MPEPTQTQQNVGSRKRNYLIATRTVAGLAPLAADVLESTVREMEGIEYVRTLSPRGLAQVLAAGLPGSGDAMKVVVARMTEDRAATLKKTAPPQVLIEEDHPLRYATPDAAILTPFDAAAMTPPGESTAINLQVLGAGGAPVANTNVYLMGNGFPAQGVTDAKGNVQLTVFGGGVDSIRALYVKPQSDYWTLYLVQPELATDRVNVVHLRPLTETFTGFPASQVIGWGQKLMNMDKLPETFTGKGVRVAVIDSGAAITHPNLDAISQGLDITTHNPTTWQQDTVFHGSHVSGIVAGKASIHRGIRGFAPEAEMHICKIFPGGRFSDLIDALDYCIEKQIDVVNLSLGGEEVSQTLEQKIIQAKQLGVACIVAAGNSGGPVQYPASSPNVLAVAAIGKLKEFPEDSYHAQTVLGDRRLIGNDGIFPAKFSCSGPQIAVAGPGVAILSSVPPQNFAAWDGTSMATPHITGLAALILAHHPDFHGRFAARNAQRVERLFQILKASCQPLNLGDPNRTGAGVPDALRAFPALTPATTAVDQQTDLLQRLLAALRSAPVPSQPVTIDQLRQGLQQAGIGPNGGNGVGPASVTPLSSWTVSPQSQSTATAVASPPTAAQTTDLVMKQLKRQLEECKVL